jgi:NAD(P)-dependent dehydrogenase (short-subunit alcohol dehydrogenase family)
MELKDRVAIVTGGAKGIGLASAECLVRLGAAVLLVDVSAEALETGKQGLGENPGHVDGVIADISKMADAERAVQTAVERFGGVDILVNNAGIQTFGDPVTTTEEIWDKTMDVNLKGHWMMSKCAIPEMLKRGKGAIVNVSSVQGLASQRNVVAYSTSKHAMIGLTRSMAVDMASRNIRVNCVCPGTVSTPMIESIIALDSDPDRLRQILNKMHPLGRIAQPSEIGEVIAFLASDRASFMTGSIVTVDGGLIVPIAGSPE